MTGDPPAIKRQPSPNTARRSLVLPDEAATARLAARLSTRARRGDVFALWGDLGSGKTAFARAFLRARLDPQLEVPSPTFTLVQLYGGEAAGDVPVYHFDLYRIVAPDDAIELGIEDAFVDGISLIEWPQRLGRHLPPARLDIHLSFGERETVRHVTLDGGGEWPRRLAGALDD